MKDHIMRQTLDCSGDDLPPITLRIADACRITGIGRSKLYQLIKTGDLEVIKAGATTLVPMTSIQALLDRYRPTSAETFRSRLGAVMHPFLANAILTAAVADAPDDLRRNLSSPDAGCRVKAEDALVERLVNAMFEADDDRASGTE